MRDALHGGGAGADDADDLVGEAGEVALRRAARVGVVPAAGVERVALERLDAGDARELGTVEGAVRHDHEAGAHAIAAVGGDDPAEGFVVPAQLRDLRLEAGVAVEVELFADGPAVGEDLGRAAVLFVGDVADLLKQGQVDVGLDVAGGAGVAVPVPGAAEVAALLDHTDVFDAGFAQARAGQQAAESAADHSDVDVVSQGLSVEAGLDVRVIDEVGELAGDLEVLLVAVVAEALVALLAVLLAEGVGIEGAVGGDHGAASFTGRLGLRRV